ncbi:MAG: InlB B-repeat-containing protein [Clostridia bacterium]
MLKAQINRKIMILMMLTMLMAALVVMSSCDVLSVIESVELIPGDFPTVYVIGDELDVSKMAIRVRTDDGAVRERPVTKAMVSGFETEQLGTKEMTIRYYKYEMKLAYVVTTKLYYDVKFDGNGGQTDAQVQSIYYGKSAIKPSDPMRTGYTFSGWYLDGKEYKFTEGVQKDIVLQAKWNINSYEVVFTDGENVLFSTKVVYNTVVSPYEIYEKDGYDVDGWYIGEQKYDFATLVTSEMTLTAKWKYNADKMRVVYMQQLDVIYNSLRSCDYSVESWDEVAAKLAMIKEQMEKETAEDMYEQLRMQFNEYVADSTLLQDLERAMQLLNENEYFEEEWATITLIYLEAKEYLSTYISGAPMPEKVYVDAMVAIDNVVTKAEDIENAKYLKNTRKRDLTNYYNILDKNFYSDENITALKEVYEQAIINIDNAAGTKATAIAYAQAIIDLSKIEILPEKIINTLLELYNVMEGYKAEDYFAREWEQIQGIKVAAIVSIREYVGGAPTLEKIIADAKVALGNVITKAEDIVLAESLKTTKIRSIENHINSLNELNYSVINWNEIKRLQAESVLAINKAIGTVAVSKAYADALVMINSVATLSDSLVNEINNLIAAYKQYKQEDYFVDQWTELEGIYNAAVVELREYVGGTPTADRIVSEATKAMGNVITKQQDISNAEYTKQSRIRELNNMVSVLKESDYTAEKWQSIQNALNSGISAINNAVGTKAVGIAFNEAYQQLKAAIEL